MSGLVLVLSLVVDCRFGEPPARFHPVVWMGGFLRRARRFNPGGGAGALAAGTAVMLFGLVLFAGAAWLIARSLAFLPLWLELPLLALLLKPTFSVRALLRAGDDVKGALGAGELPEARRLLAWHLVSRDTRGLNASEVAGAAVSSLAENVTDSLVAPLFYFLLLGLPGAVAYRFTNTADALLGYRTAELERFGKAAARLDDLVNYLPARLAALLLLLALLLHGHDARAGWRAARADARKTPSPNAGWTMATVAGGLGVRLDKRGVYTLNERGRAPHAEDIATVRRMVVAATLVFALAAVLVALMETSYA